MNQSIYLSAPTLLTVKTGMSISSFSQELVNKGWLEHRFWLRNYARLYPKKSQLKAGTFYIEANISLKELLQQLVSGKEHQFAITFIEGSTFKQWLQQLSQQKQLLHSLKNKTPAEIAKLLGISATNPDGWFFPETYAFTAGTSDLKLLERAHIKMKNQLEQLWQTRALNLPYNRRYQALIMASIVEKESRLASELPLISAVFVNRLRIKMRLQTDPTVIYGLGDRYQGNIKRTHLREKTPYNTYRIDGLPPTPIAMPGLAALKAVMHPASSNDLYFVSKGDGSHVFSSNLADHNAAVARYQLGKK